MRYSPELYKVMMARVSSGETLNKICRDDGFPTVHCAFEWVHKSEDNSKEYARAVENRASARVARIDDYGDMVIDGIIAPDAARVLIDKEKWQAGKENPKKYSDKQQIEVNHTGGFDLNVMLPATTAFIQGLLNPPTMDSSDMLTIDNVPLVDDII